VGKASFVNWLYNYDISSFEDWILLVDFNLIQSPDDRNKPGGSVSDMSLFNDLIQHLDLIDIPFEGRRFTWSNMQTEPLLEKMHWVFISSPWSLSFPGTKVIPLSKPISDHIPYVVVVDTFIPKSRIFRFENFWASLSGFEETIKLHWNNNPFYANMAKAISCNYKQLRKVLKA
jgi:hypothetical protein